MTNYIDENELENLKLEFALLNKDGKISKEEFKNLFQGSNYTEKEIEGFFYLVESDENGSINFNAFVRIMHSNICLDMNTFAKNLFKDLDANKDGMVTFEEFKTIIDLLPDAPVNKKNLKSDFEKADTNMDGNISLEEFVAYLNNY